MHSQARIVITLTDVYEVRIRLFHKFAFFLRIKINFLINIGYLFLIFCKIRYSVEEFGAL